MDELEAKEILTSEIETYREMSYKDLVQLMDSCPIVSETIGKSGANYCIETDVFWDNKGKTNVRVISAIDDGRGWRAFKPLTDSFIKDPNGRFVGE